MAVIKDADLVHARLVSKIGVQGGTGIVESFAASKQQALYVPGGGAATSADNAALDITGDIDIRVWAAISDWTPADTGQLLLQKWTTTGNQRSYRFSVNQSSGSRGKLLFEWSTNGQSGGAHAINSTALPAVGNGGLLWVRVTMDVDNGASDATITFYTSADGSAWTQLGDPVLAGGITSIHSGTSILTIMPSQSTGIILRGLVYAGIEATLKFDANFTTQAPGTTSFADAASSLTVTVAAPAFINTYPEDA